VIDFLRAWLAYRRFYRRSVVVNLTDGTAFRGVLWQARGPLLILRSAILHEHGQTTAVDGEVLVERNRLLFVQVLPVPEVP
jgi:hypothetical protein